MVKFENSFSMSLKDIILFASVILAIAAAWYGLPSRIMADTDSKFYTKESAMLLTQRVENIDKKLDTLLLHFGIKGIEK